jgi:hypothetical protein
MTKAKKDVLQKIQEGRGKDIAKLFFYHYFTPGIVTKIIYEEAFKMRREKKRQGFVMPIVREYLEEWKKEGFIETSPIKIPFNVERRGKTYTLENYGYRLNLEPLYRYCKNKGIEFSQEEKEVINKRVGLEAMRKRIIIEYPNEDLINAILKFYIKHFGIPHLEILNEKDRKKLEYFERIAERELKKANEFKKKMNRKLKSKKLTPKDKELVNVEQEIYNLYLEKSVKMLAEGKLHEDELEGLARNSALLLYVSSYKKNPELISNINKKFKIALGIY